LGGGVAAPSEKLIKLDDVQVLEERRTRSGRALMRSGSEKIRDLGVRCVLRPPCWPAELTHRFSSLRTMSAQRLSGTVPHAMVCVPATAIYSFIDTFLVFPIHSCFIAGFIPLLFLFVLVYIPSLPFCYAGFARFFHTSVPIVMYFIRLGFTLQPISSSLLFSCLCCEDIIMFSVYFVPESRLSPQAQTCDLHRIDIQ